MAFSQSDLDELDKAVASGELTVSYQGRTTTFRSIAELERARAIVKAELNAGGASSEWPSGRRVARFTNGLC